MTTSIVSPSSPLLPPAANRLWVSDTWNNGLGVAPQFVYKLQVVTPSPDGEVVTDLRYDNVSMSQEQWNGWSSGADDENYILDCVALNLGLVRT